MILGVISDTHGNHVLMHKAVDLLQRRFQAAHILHLGDDYEDKEVLEAEGVPVTGVPGLWCREYHDGRIPNVLRLDFAGLRVVCAHAAHDLPPFTSDIGLVLFGHTHRFLISTHDGVPCMNPGHLKSEHDRMRQPTFGVVSITDTTIRLSIHDLRGHTLTEESFPRKDAPEKPSTA